MGAENQQERPIESLSHYISDFFGCGYVKPNHPGSFRDITEVYIVRNRQDLLEKIIPFFEKYPLISQKMDDFKKFAHIVKLMDKGKHLSREVLVNLTKLAFSMYNGKYRKLSLEKVISLSESSETVRRLPKGKDTVRAAWRHAEVSRND